MKKFTLPLLFTSLALSACATSSLTEQEMAPVTPTETEFSGDVKTVDEAQSVISFTGKSDVINHEGKFTKYVADVSLDAEEPANLAKASITVVVDMTSAVTDAEVLNGHLQKEDFFDTAKYPEATFVSTSIVQKEGTQYDVTGDLTLKGQTKSITFPAEITNDYITAEFNIPREEFGIGNNTYGQKLLDAQVPVKVKIVFAK